MDNRYGLLASELDDIASIAETVTEYHIDNLGIPGQGLPSSEVAERLGWPEARVLIYVDAKYSNALHEFGGVYVRGWFGGPRTLTIHNKNWQLEERVMLLDNEVNLLK